MAKPTITCVEGLENEDQELVLPSSVGSGFEDLVKALDGFQLWHIDGGYTTFQDVLGDLLGAWADCGAPRYHTLLRQLDRKWETKYGDGSVQLSIHMSPDPDGATRLLDVVRESVKQRSNLFTPSLLECCEKELPASLKELALGDIPSFLQTTTLDFDDPATWAVSPEPRARLAYFFFVCVLAPLVHSSLDLCSLPEPTTTVVNIAASTLAKKKASDKASAPSDSSCYSHPTVLVDKKPVVFPINGPELLTKIPMHFFSSNPCAQTLHTVLSKPTFQASAVKASIVLEWERVPARLAESLASALEDGETAAIVAHAVLELHREKLGRSLLPLTHTTTLNVFTSTTTPAKHLRDIDSVHMMRPSEDSDVYVSLVDLGEVVGKSVVSGHRDVLFQSINHMQHPWGWDLMYPFYVLYCLQDFTLDCGSMMCGGKGRAW
eukprot:CAMPEP_0177675716 /NCGR_PEP_ID=MMETSP0447-20121125/27359_1 /TAXON_ID=0 /ORGANISM="Stygamoeba regulata, Strain BSH-02190019" /LENGTH=434 /DNA_ID=CAMNT_0019184141 /DNA_START=43 /DNA_END=1344 /DNA_ORIENTATION=+